MLVGIALALGSAIAHAGWNTVVKRLAGDGAGDGLAALWAYSLAGLLVVLSATAVAMGVVGSQAVTPQLLRLSAISTVLHTAYAATLQAAYRNFDVSQVYPVSRGLAPVMTALVGLPLLGQRLTGAQWAGVLLMGVAVGVLLAECSHLDRQRLSWRPMLWSVGIGTTVAAYTSFDGWAVVSQGVDPLAYYTVGAALQLGLITVLLRGKVGGGFVQLRRHRRPVALLAMLIPTSYLMGLYATQHAPVSLVAAVRSTSLVWAALAATLVLRERVNTTRMLATVLAAASIIAMIPPI